MNPVKVFIVDDSAQLIEVLSELIEDAGRVAVCGTADTARASIEAIERLRPDIVITDLQLREGNGFEVIDAIGRSAIARGTCRPLIVLFSNHLGSELKKSALARGADHFLDKTADHERLLELIRECADRRA